jgi:hypothetical protein
VQDDPAEQIVYLEEADDIIRLHADILGCTDDEAAATFEVRMG